MRPITSLNAAPPPCLRDSSIEIGATGKMLSASFLSMRHWRLGPVNRRAGAASPVSQGTQLH